MLKAKYQVAESGQYQKWAVWKASISEKRKKMIEPIKKLNKQMPLKYRKMTRLSRQFDKLIEIESKFIQRLFNEDFDGSYKSIYDKCKHEWEEICKTAHCKQVDFNEKYFEQMYAPMVSEA
jgi:hypothetical protein